ncbi:MAG: LppX_LprAFG lipoprotein [Anaerolineales bacterium]|nr:LppX_LprAFG lipoprotein [Anaerolineales bacterium]
MSKRIILWAGLIVLGALLTGCGNSQLEKFSPNEIVSRAAERMASLTGFEFLVDRFGAPAFLDFNETISFRRAEGQYVNPDRVYAKVRVIAPGLVAEVQLINIEGEQWETNLLSGEWQISDTNYTFNPSLLFDPNQGIPFILANHLKDTSLIGMEEIPEVPGKKLYAITANMQGEYANAMTYGMIDKDPLDVKVWIEPNTFDVYRIILVDPADAGEAEPTTWQIDFWNFGKTFDIQKP